MLLQWEREGEKNPKNVLKVNVFSIQLSSQQALMFLQALFSLWDCQPPTEWTWTYISGNGWEENEVVWERSKDTYTETESRRENRHGQKTGINKTSGDRVKKVVLSNLVAFSWPETVKTFFPLNWTSKMYLRESLKFCSEFTLFTVYSFCAISKTHNWCLFFSTQNVAQVSSLSLNKIFIFDVFPNKRFHWKDKAKKTKKLH